MNWFSPIYLNKIPNLNVSIHADHIDGIKIIPLFNATDEVLNKIADTLELEVFPKRIGRPNLYKTIAGLAADVESVLMGLVHTSLVFNRFELIWEMKMERSEDFKESWDNLAKDVHSNAVNKGFWESEINVGEKLCLIHEEISEALSAIRSGNPQDEKVPSFKNFEVELADAIIRIMDLAQGLGLDVGGAVIAKHEYNKGRPYKHGKSF